MAIGIAVAVDWSFICWGFLPVASVWLRWEKCALIQLCDPADHVHERSRHVKSLPPHVPGSDVHMTRRPAETRQGAQFKAFVITHELSGSRIATCICGTSFTRILCIMSWDAVRPPSRSAKPECAFGTRGRTLSNANKPMMCLRPEGCFENDATGGPRTRWLRPRPR